MIPVILESPYAGDIPRNILYARDALRDSLDRGEAPFASHLLYTQPGVLDDTNPVQRKQGIAAGFVWGEFAKKVVVYCDLGISAGMWEGIDNAQRLGKEIEFRSLPAWKKFHKYTAIDAYEHFLLRNCTRKNFKPDC